MNRHRSSCLRGFVAAAAACAVVGAAACSEDAQDDARQAADSIAEEVGDAAQTAVSNVQEAAGEAIDDATELAARNLAAEYGEREFDEAGYPIDDEGLSCEATATDDATALDVSCSGMTEDDSEAMLTGRTGEIPGASLTELEGDFTGSVDGGEIFTTDRLGG